MDPSMTPEEVRAITAEAYIYAYPMIASYGAMFNQAIDPDSPEYLGGFNVIKNTSVPVSPENHDVAPNVDTRPSWAWLDLRADPFVLSVPAVAHDRYYALQWFDLCADLVGSIGVRTTGFAAGSYLIAGPDWEGETPEGIVGVLRSASQLAALRGQTLLDGPEDVTALTAIQSQYRLEALSQFLAQVPPPAAPEIDWLPWEEEALRTRAFLPYLTFLLQFCQQPPAEAELMQRFARIGIVPGADVDVADLDPAMQQAIDAGVADGVATLHAAASAAATNELLGSGEEPGFNSLKRAAAARTKLYGNAVGEEWNGSWEVSADGEALDGSRRYRLHFAPEALPPAHSFWSVTMYSLPDRVLVANPIDRYAIGDRTKGLQHDEDGSLAILISHDAPDQALQASWLPAPAGPFTLVLRVYGPKPELLDGTWQLPPLEVVDERH